MADSRDLIERVAQGIEASKKISTTPPGQTETSVSEAQVDAINQVFALFRLNYHNQYYAAFPDASQLKQIKKLWLESLADYPVEQILRGAKHAIENSEYLPTLKAMHSCCQQGLKDFGLPAAREAYLEACQAPSPRSAQRWSHPAVYLAGRDSDWHFLSNNIERVSWPVFREHYQQYCSRAIKGEKLTVPAPAAIEKPTSKPMDKTEKLNELHRLREKVGL